MSIENLPGLKVVGKIDLSRFEKYSKSPAPETYLPALETNLKDLADRLKVEYGDFFEDNGQIKMTGEEEDQDRELVKTKEKAWASESGKSVEAMKTAREKNPANIAEVATTLLFDKVLRDDFMIVRASTFDDYENGADQLIIDKRTGAIICGLDDVIGRNGDDGGAKKQKKLDDKMKNGGAKIKYGVALNDGRLERKSLRHIPIFFFGLSKPELNSLLESLTAARPGLSAAEKTIYSKLVDSLSGQVGEYELKTDWHPELKNNLRAFAPSLDKMRSYTGTS